MNTLGAIIVWMMFGLIVGLIARMLYPGRQSMGLIATMFLGIAGSLVGGFISWMFGFDPQDGAFQSSGWIMSIVGAIVVVWLSLVATSNSSTPRSIT